MLYTRDTTDDLPMQIHDHFTRIRESETPGDDQAQASIAVRSRTKLIAFMVNRVRTKEQVEHQRELKDLPGNLDYRREFPIVQSYIDGTRQKEWKKHEDFQAAIPLKGKELSDLLEAGHVPIPSKWVDTIKNIHKSINPTMFQNSSRGWYRQLRRCGRRTYRRPYFRHRNTRTCCSVSRVPRCTAVFVGHQEGILPGDANRPRSENASTARQATRSRP